MRNALAAALLTVFAVVPFHPARAQSAPDRDDLADVRQVLQRLPGRASNADTVWIGHTSAAPHSLPWHVGVGPHRPGVGGSHDGMWDFDTYDGGAIDSMQGWIPTVSPNARTAGTITDDLRPWNCLDWGNRLDATPVQGRTPGVIGAWHVDHGAGTPSTGAPAGTPPWSGDWAWCGLRAGDDGSVVDAVARGGTGNAINGGTLLGQVGDGVNGTRQLFPGYADQWDQMLYRDVRVASGGALTITFDYATAMDPRTDNAAKTCKGWFDKDPLSMQQGGTGIAAGNFISASAYLGSTARSGPVDSFMVYVGVPADPAACRYTDGGPPRPIYDLKRRWFSEVLAIDKPYRELLSTSGDHDASGATFTVGNASLQPMLDAQGAADGGGILRLVFRSKTNASFSDETGTGGSYTSGGSGAARVTNVAIAGCTPAFATSTFASDGEIDDTIEPADRESPGPAVGPGHAFAAWHATGKPPKHMAHTHPLFGGDIGGGNYYPPLAYADLCGPPDSPIRQCNIDNVIVSTTDHDLGEAAGGALGTPFLGNRNGLLSPAINLVTPATGVNDIGLDRAHVTSRADWLITYDIYAGIFAASQQGNVWGNSIQCWPARQSNGCVVWGDIAAPAGVWAEGEQRCLQMTDLIKPLILTSNESGIPDSLRLWIFREQRCISWAVTVGCSPTDGHYVDNVALCIPPELPGVDELGTINADPEQWINDTFPANEDPALPGTAAFDTCAALIRTGVNLAPSTGDARRFDVPADSTVIVADGDGMRVDLVFRILPGPGNYVVAGNKASGLRRVPTSAAAATPGDGSFWGEYMQSPGEFSKGSHAGRWDPDTWNSARCDTAEQNLFPVDGRAENLGGLVPGRWASTYHEEDSKFGTLGILKHRCFLSDTSPGLPIDHTNITCSSVPGWLAALPPERTGYDGDPQTREYTRIIPDGILTAGSHVEYFFRKSRIADPAIFSMVPDTERIAPQPGEGDNLDGHRWQQFGVLPDRWKDVAYGGLGSACIFFVDAADGRGDERVWVGTMDSTGGTTAAKYGAHNGWHCTAAYVAPDGSHDYYGEADLGSDPGIAVWKHGGQPGTTWDLYGVKGAGTLGGAAGALGSRLANRSGMGLLAGRESRQGPTPLMLRTYYRTICFASADLNRDILGPLVDRSQDDIALLQDFLTDGADPLIPRGIWTMGNGFVEASTDVDAAHMAFLSDNLAVRLEDPDYYALSGAVVAYPDLLPSTVLSPWGHVFSVRNGCAVGNDVLNVNTDVAGAAPASWYQNLGANGPYVSGVYAPSTPGHPYVSLVDGWAMSDLFGRHGADNCGRLSYVTDVLTYVFGSVCPFLPIPQVCVEGIGCGPWWEWSCWPTGVPIATSIPPPDFVAVRNNPLVSGVATVRLGLAAPDRVEVRIHDLAGRTVRVLADRAFPAGEHVLTWDGTDDHGRRLPHGVYFTAVRYARVGFHAERKITILR